jgi:hypothetical protein
MKLRSLLRSFNLLNALLFVILLAILQYLLLPTATVDIRYAPSALKKSAETEEQASGEPQPAQVLSPVEYTVIAEQNLFHPDRHIPPDKKDAPPLPKPEFVLYGVMMSDEVTLAYMEDQKAPQSTPGRGKRQTALKKGDSLSGFVLKEVDPGKVVMVRGEERVDVYLNDAAHPKKRDGTVTSATSAPAAQPGAPAVQAPRLPVAAAPPPPQPQVSPPTGAAAPATPDPGATRRRATDALLRDRNR